MTQALRHEQWTCRTLPRRGYYDYLIRDPTTGRVFGVEVKTTMYDTMRLDAAQVAKDVTVVAQGGRVRVLGLEVTGVGYQTYCFGCALVDVRSSVLQSILEGAGVPIVRGSLPGDIRP